MTKLYFHAASSLLSNLPTAEQSALTSAKNGDAQTVNRLMNTTIGTAETNITLTTNASAALQDYYFTKFVSDPLSGITSVTAQTWNYGFSASEPNAAANFPVSGASQPVYLCAYVWRPSTQTKVGNIIDGNTSSTYSEPAATNTETSQWGTFTGSLVSSVQDGDVIVAEIWFRITQGGATARADIFLFDGTTETTNTGTTTTSIASYIETPQSLTFQSLTKLYFHNILNTLANLPTAEQSALTAIANVDAQTVNRVMDLNIGVSQASIALTSNATASAQDYYFTKFVTYGLNGISSIAAGTWVYAFAARESAVAANFPAGAASSPVYVNCYVWRPSNQTIVGTILDGNTASVYAEVGAANSERAMYGTFTGSAVSSISNDDVIVIEIWFRITQASATANTDTFYYDGTTENTTLNATVTNHASYIASYNSLAFLKKALAPVTETISISDNSARLSTKARTLSESVSNSSSVSRIGAKQRRPGVIQRWL